MHGIHFGSGHRDGLGLDRFLDKLLSVEMTFDVVNASHCIGSWSALSHGFEKVHTQGLRPECTLRHWQTC
jgi:hypothetical protein